MKRIIYILILIGLIIIGSGCKKNPPLETDPAKIILGKWEIYEMGSETVLNPNAYEEFLPDSILREYEYSSGEYYYKIYWIDSLLHKGVYNHMDDEILLFEYKYEFIDCNNKLLLEYTNIFATYNNFKFKRIK